MIKPANNPQIASPLPQDWYLIGRFLARAVTPGGLLYHGIEHALTRRPESYEASHIIIEIYDPRYKMDDDLPGQFVTAYGAATLRADRHRGGRLAMHGGIEGWTMTLEETKLLGDLAEGLITGEWS